MTKLLAFFGIYKRHRGRHSWYKTYCLETSQVIIQTLSSFSCRDSAKALKEFYKFSHDLCLTKSSVLEQEVRCHRCLHSSDLLFTPFNLPASLLDISQTLHSVFKKETHSSFLSNCHLAFINYFGSKRRRIFYLDQIT